jgi:DHA3 family macrolide efflux protein-like MFS transporter
MPLGYLLAGPLVDHVFTPLVAPGGAAAAINGWLGGGGAGQAIGLTLVALGILTVLATAVGYVYPPLWHIEDELKDASPDADLAAELAA